jgi:hypothetical protein
MHGAKSVDRRIERKGGEGVGQGGLDGVAGRIGDFGPIFHTLGVRDRQLAHAVTIIQPRVIEKLILAMCWTLCFRIEISRKMTVSPPIRICDCFVSKQGTGAVSDSGGLRLRRFAE